MGPDPEEDPMSDAAVAGTRVLAPADISQVAVFAALIAALSLAPGFAIGPVPITLQTLGVALAGLCLGPWRGSLACLLYLVVGLAGLPVFAQGRAGLAVLAAPSAGYLIAFPLAAIVTGLIARRVVQRGLTPATPVLLFCAVVAARLLVIWPVGAAGMARALGISYPQAIVADMAFWAGDAIKAAIAAALALAVHKAFPRLLGR